MKAGTARQYCAQFSPLHSDEADGSAVDEGDAASLKTMELDAETGINRIAGSRGRMVFSQWARRMGVACSMLTILLCGAFVAARKQPQLRKHMINMTTHAVQQLRSDEPWCDKYDVKVSGEHCDPSSLSGIYKRTVEMKHLFPVWEDDQGDKLYYAKASVLGVDLGHPLHWQLISKKMRQMGGYSLIANKVDGSGNQVEFSSPQSTEGWYSPCISDPKQRLLVRIIPVKGPGCPAVTGNYIVIDGDNNVVGDDNVIGAGTTTTGK